MDRHFFAEVWQPQEAMHGRILDELQTRLGSPPATVDLDTVSLKIRLLGALAHLDPVQDVVRMLYYLTGMTTERSALLSYHLLNDGLVEMGETALAQTVITPIRRQEPGHYAFYQMSCRALWSKLDRWQQWLVRRLRAVSFAPVAANGPGQLAEVAVAMSQPRGARHRGPRVLRRTGVPGRARPAIRRGPGAASSAVHGPIVQRVPEARP